MTSLPPGEINSPLSFTLEIFMFITDFWGEIVKSVLDLFINHNGFISIIGLGIGLLILHYTLIRHYVKYRLDIIKEEAKFADWKTKLKNNTTSNPVFKAYTLSALALLVPSFTSYFGAVYNDSGHNLLISVLGTTNPSEYLAKDNAIVSGGRAISINCTPSLLGKSIGLYDKDECVKQLKSIQLKYSIKLDTHRLQHVAKLDKGELITVVQNNQTIHETLLALEEKNHENSNMSKLKRRLVATAK